MSLGADFVRGFFSAEEIKRVLKPGGIFIAIVDGGLVAPGYEEVHSNL